MMLIPFSIGGGNSALALKCTRCKSFVNTQHSVSIAWPDRIDLFRLTGDCVFAQISKHNPKMKQMIYDKS